MAALLELPEVRERLSRLSVEEYHRLDEFNEHGRRTELIRGFIIEKMSKPGEGAYAERLFVGASEILSCPHVPSVSVVLCDLSAA